MMRLRLAPSAVRKQISERRPIPRASSRLAILAQAIRRTRRGDNHEQAKVGRVILLQVLDASAAGCEHDMDFREQRLPFPGGKSLALGERVAHHGAQLLLQGGQRDARLHAADHVQPLHIGIVHVADIRQHGHGFDGQIEIRRRAGEAIAIEALGSDADDGHGLGIDPECAADDGRFAGIIVLPGGVADDRGHGGARDVIRVVNRRPAWA